MSKVSGLQLVKPRFDWEAHDKLTEIEQFKADCKILFEGPLSDLKDKQWAGLIINWLGREATQILISVEADTGTPYEVFDVLEKVFRPESNQTIARFKLNNLKQNQHQSVDAYMSQLRLALPECKFKNDTDDLLKDQFIFGLFNKEIQDHLLGEISETDNRVKSLYEARKIESKLEQRKMLGIVRPDNLVDVNAVKKKVRFQKINDCDNCGHSHDKGNCPAYGKTCNRCGMKNHFAKKCKQSNNDVESRSHNRPRSKDDCDKCKSCGKSKKEFTLIEIDSNDCEGCSTSNSNQMEDLMEQVQSLFSH